MSTDLDRRVAEIVGWVGRDYLPSTDVECAIAALEAMREKGWRWELKSDPSPGSYRCAIVTEKAWHNERYPFWYQGVAETLPLAICKAIVATREEK